MADNQTAQQTSQQQQQQQHGQVAQQQHQQQQAAAVPQRQISQNQPQAQPTQNQQAQQQPNTIQQQQQQQQQPIQPTQQQQPIQQQQVQQQQQQQIQQLPQLQQIAPQQPQHVMSNLQGHTMTSVPLSMAMGTNPIYNNIGSMRPQQLGQLPQVQVIHQAMQSPPYLPQFYNQQLMLQNMQAAMQANMVNMNPQQINMANMVAMQGRPNTNMFAQMSQGPATPTTPNLISISSGANTSLTQLTSTAAGTANTSKPVQAGVNKQQSQQQGTLQQQQTQQQQQGNQQQQQQQAQIHTLGPVQQAQATAMVGGKPIILGQATGSLLQGQLGVISAGQIPTSQAYTGQAFGQIQSKTNQQIGVNNAGQGQSIQMSSQSTMRFSQPQMIASNAGNAQLITSPITNQMLQAMASQLQQYPQQPIMSAQGQSPTIIAGQGLYIRSANPVQAQGLMAGVQTAINPNFKGTNQQTVQIEKAVGTLLKITILETKNISLQNVALPIQKQTTAAQTGKVLLPSVSKAVTAKVLPSNTSATVKTGNQAMAKPKGRPKGVAKVTTPVSSASNEVPIKSESPASNASKPSTPTNQTPALPSHDTKNQSDSDNELGKKLVVNEDQEDLPEENEEKQTETKMTESITEKESPTKQDPVPEPPPVEKQRAIVKPHILTHVIEGFVIQEGPEPFPVQRSSLMTEFIPPKPGQPVEQSSLISMEDEDMDQDDTTSVEDQGSSNGQKMLRCECCNGSYPESKFNPTQRFCSKSCAKRYNVGCSKRLQHFPGRPKDKGRVLKRKRHGKGKRGVHGNRLQSSSSTGGGGDDMDMEDQSSSMSQDESPSPSTTPDHRLHTPPPELQLESDLHVPLTSPTKWNVQDVYEFVKALPGCSTYADEFKSQEIDGQALLLLKEDHLMTTMNMKLGPALKICARINAIKEETG